MAGRKSTKRKFKLGTSDPFFVQGLLAATIGTVGLLVAFGLVWWSLVFQPSQISRDLERDREVAKYTEFFNSRITDLRTTVGALATSPATIEAMSSYNIERQQQASAAMTAQHPYVRRVSIIGKGQAEVDLNAEVPISFAALDLIRRAETREFVGPEVSLNQRDLVYAAHAITTEGAVAGVLLVVFDQDFFLQPLTHYTSMRGLLEIKQTFQGNPPQAVMSIGNETSLRPPVEEQLFAPHWRLAYSAPLAAAPLANGVGVLLIPALVAWGLLLGGIYLSFNVIARKLKADAIDLTDYAERAIRGRSARPSHMRLLQMQTALDRLAGAAGKAAPQPDKAPDPSEQAEQAEQENAGASRADTEQAEAADEEAALHDHFLKVASVNSSKDNFGIQVSEDVSPATTGLALDPTIFRAYDIRGITTQNLTEDAVYWIGRAFAAQALSEHQTHTAVGWDGRHSSDPLQKSLIRGLTEGGMDVMAIGMVPTPMLYYATFALDTGTGIMITGSHNPPEYNGLKMMIGGTTLAEGAIQALKTRLDNNDLSTGEGDVERVDLDDSYIDRMLDDAALAQPLKVVVDCGNGVAGKIAPRLLRELGCEVIDLYCDVDGDFPNHHPDPADPETLEDLRTVVEAEQAELGLAFDGDGDRLGVVTNSGAIIWPDKLLMLFAQDIVSRNPGADIIYDVKCSRHLSRIIGDLGGRPIMWKTGHSHMKAKMKETGALLGGEFSGHICFAERWYGFDDALYSAVRLLEILGTEGGTADEVFERFPSSQTTPEIKINTTEDDKWGIMERLSADADFGEGTVTAIDGIRVDYPEGWGLIRPSNTSPVLTLRFEADNAEALERIQDRFQSHLDAIDPGLKFR